MAIAYPRFAFDQQCNLVANAINPVTYEGLRLSALWNIHDDCMPCWSELPEHECPGVFYEMPKSSDGVPLPQQSVTLFNPLYKTASRIRR